MKKIIIQWLARLLPPCAQIMRLGSDALERPLTRRERVQMKLHFLICVWCERYVKQIRLLHETLHHQPADASPAKLSPAARDRLKAALARPPGDFQKLP